jgi:hypothetical protein
MAWSAKPQPRRSGCWRNSGVEAVKPTVFIQTNDKQILGAKVAEYSMRKQAKQPDSIDVRIITTDQFPFLAEHEGRKYLREGKSAFWTMNDLQSFTPLRFTVPELMNYSGRAVVTDPDVFALADIGELLERDMQGAAILARKMPPSHRRPAHYASSVMLLDCAKLKHWHAARDFDELFAFRRDYRDWMWLLLEPKGSVGELEEGWNHFDTLDARTKLLHNTHRRTQPWKTGLPADFTPRDTTLSSRAGSLLRRLGKGLTGGPQHGRYQPHPDPNQEAFFFGLLGECLDSGAVTPELLQQEIKRGNIRSDAFALVARARAA